MLKVGLTGSIAVGKSFVCGVLSELGCHVLDADQTAREVVEPGTEGLRRIVKEFGREILLPTGRLDRKMLGGIVFSEPGKRQLLNSILHPLIIDEQDKWVESCSSTDPDGIAVIEAALMIESGGYKRFDELIVVWCGSDIQLQRLMKRNSIGLEEAEKMIAAQMPQEEKKRYASFLIDTSGSFDETRLQIEAVYKELRKLEAGGIN